ncbi:MAG: RtcB family protein [Clostridiales bacterium]|nr:RtcB family protein [Clostridiales bacterium]
MFVKYDKEKNSHPIKIWLDSIESIEESCLEQAMNLSNLPFIHKWVALMPDTHTGMGMPIGSVIATENVIIPNAVGSDIGCGMIYTETSIKADLLRNTPTANGSLLQLIIGDIMRNIPVGFAKHKSKQSSPVLDKAFKTLPDDIHKKALLKALDNAYYQVGTLGGGNHFIELQEDDENNLMIMIHSGSRHLGNEVCKYFHSLARAENLKYHSSVPDAYRLSFFPTDTYNGESYIRYMHLALECAYENRKVMLDEVKDIIKNEVMKHCHVDVHFNDALNRHHNYAELEHHYGKKVWVHRKGAIRAKDGELGIIPGAMGSYSYIVMGKGNPESFNSCSHGAGRKYSRTKAKELISSESVMTDLKSKHIVLGKKNKSDVAEEALGSYKDIDFVINNELDLITPIKKLKTVGVVKG